MSLDLLVLENREKKELKIFHSHIWKIYFGSGHYHFDH